MKTLENKDKKKKVNPQFCQSEITVKIFSSFRFCVYQYSYDLIFVEYMVMINAVL